MDAAMAVGEKRQMLPSSPSAAAGEKRRKTSPSGAAADADGTRSSVAAQFRSEYREFNAEAIAMAACGVNVHTIVFFPGGSGAVQCTYRGAASKAEAQAQEKRKHGVEAAAAAARGLVEQDASRMTLEEVKAHRERLLALRAAVVRKLKEKAAINAGGGRCNKIN